MSVHLATFADSFMSRSQEMCARSARLNGIHIPRLYGPDSIKRFPCYEANRELFESARGLGYWAWKPAILNQLIGDDSFVNNVRDNDIIVYADAGIEFVDNVNYVIDRMDQDIFLFGNNWEHAHWCKRDVIEEILRGSGYSWPREPPWEMFDKQAQASVIFFRVSGYTRTFVKEWLDWCLFEDGRLIDDSPSRTLNHPEFREHRHDQAILTTMAYREGIKLHWWPAVYNDGAFTYERGDYLDEGYPVLFHHHRRRNNEWEKVA